MALHTVIIFFSKFPLILINLKVLSLIFYQKKLKPFQV